MKKLNKVLALLLALGMILGLAACGPKAPAPSDNPEGPNPPATTGTPSGEVTNPDDIPDTMDAADGKYQVAFITDVGDLKDKSFNQGTFDGVKLYAAANGKSYKYYKPANANEATDDDRYDAMKAAVEGGAEVVVCAGFMQGTALGKAAEEFSDTKFVFIDGWPLTAQDGSILNNVAAIAFNEAECGYFAGYAVVKEGFTKLGFSGGGGGNNPACCRFGYGFVQGANAAAAELNTTVDCRYSWEYGETFTASPELQSKISGWYENGTEVVFACGGSMFQSIAAAAAANDGFVVGVDVDQSSQSETVITSAMKGLADAAVWACTEAFEGRWDAIGGTGTSLGAAQGSTRLPTDTWRLKNYSVEEYEAQFQSVVDGSLVIDADYEANLNQAYSNLNLIMD